MSCQAERAAGSVRGEKVIRFMKSKFRRGMPQAAVLLAVLLAVLTAGCGNNAAAPEMTDRGIRRISLTQR